MLLNSPFHTALLVGFAGVAILPGMFVQAAPANNADLKHSTGAQYSDASNQRGGDVQISLQNGRPTITSPDGSFSIALRTLVQFDMAYYSKGNIPAIPPLSSGSNFRRARLGVSGKAFIDWSYEFLYDLGGSGGEVAVISSAFIQYNGLAPIYFKIGAYAPPESFEDSTSASDLLFLERAQPADVARGIAGADGRNAVSVFSYDENYFAAASYTAGLVNDAVSFDKQQAFVGRAAYRIFKSENASVAVGGDLSYVFKLAGPAAAPTIARLRERPELNVDSGNIRLIDTSGIDASNVLEWGIEAAGNWHNFYAQSGYFNFDVARRASALSDPSFNGWYLQGSWVLTGEAKPYRADRGAYGQPTPVEPFSLETIGIGAWELAARYSVLTLDHNAGNAGATTPLGGIRGGEQKIYTVGLNWYPNNAIRFVLNYQHTDVSRLASAGTSLNAALDATSFRIQLSL